jgi:hypothetical protein
VGPAPLISAARTLGSPAEEVAVVLSFVHAQEVGSERQIWSTQMSVIVVA